MNVHLFVVYAEKRLPANTIASGMKGFILERRNLSAVVSSRITTTGVVGDALPVLMP
jgi:hypothetical protein